MTNWSIIDLDNCISRDLWRRGLRDPKRPDPFDRFHAYHSLSAFDEYPVSTSWVTRQTPNNIILTGRPLWYRPITEEWLKRNHISYKHLLMRNNDDHRPSLEVKTHMLAQLWHTYDIRSSAVTLAVDDQEDIVALYKEAGLPATRVFIDEGH